LSPMILIGCCGLTPPRHESFPEGSRIVPARERFVKGVLNIDTTESWRWAFVSMFRTDPFSRDQ
jgi:hypothetical protein